MESIEISSPGELHFAAEMILRHSGGKGVVAFYGPMGAGKTTLIREICRLLGTTDTVTSPTFALVNQYDTGGGQPVFHFDFYRIDDIREAFDLGYEEYFYGGALCLVEWPEKIAPLLPEETVSVRIAVTGNTSRIISVE